jgi:hypothetical protein
LCIQLRNLSTVVISSLFCLWGRHSKDLLDQTAYEQGADRAHPDTILDDFQMVLVSLIPYKHFQRYINQIADSEFKLYLDLWEEISLLQCGLRVIKDGKNDGEENDGRVRRDIRMRQDVIEKLYS